MALRSLTRYFEGLTGSALALGVIAIIQTFVDRIIDHLKLTFVAEEPTTSHVFEQVALMAAEESVALRDD